MKDSGLFLDFTKSIKDLINTLSQYKVAIVLDNSIACLLALASNCAVVSPIAFYDEVIKYSDSQSLNEGILLAFQKYENKETIDIGKKIREKYNFETFDKNLYDLIINLTKEPFLL
jgi:hypothetical protein